MRRSLVVRLDGVIAHPVQVGVIDGIRARVSPGIQAHSSCQRAKGSGLWSRALGLTGMRSQWSSCFRVEPFSDEVSEMPPEFKVGALPEEEVLGTLAVWKSAPEFFRVLAMPAKLTDFKAGVDDPLEV